MASLTSPRLRVSVSEEPVCKASMVARFSSMRTAMEYWRRATGRCSCTSHLRWDSARVVMCSDRLSLDFSTGDSNQT